MFTNFDKTWQTSTLLSPVCFFRNLGDLYFTVMTSRKSKEVPPCAGVLTLFTAIYVLQLRSLET